VKAASETGVLVLRVVDHPDEHQVAESDDQSDDEHPGAHERCRLWALLKDTAHDLFEAEEITIDQVRSIVDMAPDDVLPCEDRTCPTCYRQPKESA
jgi:hypothetical protein